MAIDVWDQMGLKFHIRSKDFLTVYIRNVFVWRQELLDSLWFFQAWLIRPSRLVCTYFHPRVRNHALVVPRAGSGADRFLWSPQKKLLLKILTSLTSLRPNRPISQKGLCRFFSFWHFWSLHTSVHLFHWVRLTEQEIYLFPPRKQVCGGRRDLGCSEKTKVANLRVLPLNIVHLYTCTSPMIFFCILIKIRSAPSHLKFA